MNSINIIGRLTADIEIRRTQSGKAVASYSLAVRRPRTKDVTDFLNVVTWEQGAEYLSKYAHKGDTVAVSGMLTGRQWEDKEGRKRTSFEIVSESVELLSSKKNTEASSNTNQTQNSYPGGYGGAQQGYNPNSYTRQVNQPQQGYQQQGFGGYQQNDYPELDGDDAKLPF